MKTRNFDYLNIKIGKPEVSFQYDAGGLGNPRWNYVRRDSDGQPMRWHTVEQRDAARACFTHRKSLAAAMADLQDRRLHVGQPGQPASPQPETAERHEPCPRPGGCDAHMGATCSQGHMRLGNCPYWTASQPVSITKS